jgi:hypothetical protein
MFQINVSNSCGRGSAVSRRNSPEGCDRPALRKDRKGAGKAGSWPPPWLRATKHAVVTTGSAETSRPSLRDGFNAYTYSPWCAGLFGHHCPCDAKHHHERNTSVGVSGRYDFTSASSAARHTAPMRPPHPVPTYRDDAYAPFDGTGCAHHAQFLEKRK